MGNFSRLDSWNVFNLHRVLRFWRIIKFRRSFVLILSFKVIIIFFDFFCLLCFIPIWDFMQMRNILNYAEVCIRFIVILFIINLCFNLFKMLIFFFKILLNYSNLRLKWDLFVFGYILYFWFMILICIWYMFYIIIVPLPLYLITILKLHRKFFSFWIKLNVFIC